MHLQWEKPKLDELLALYKSVEWDDAQTFAPKLLSDSWNTLCVRNEQGELIGFAAVFASNEIAHVSDVCVRPDYQGKGLGKQLVEEVVRFTREKGFKGLKLDYEMKNKTFYDKVLS